MSVIYGSCENESSHEYVVKLMISILIDVLLAHNPSLSRKRLSTAEEDGIRLLTD